MRSRWVEARFADSEGRLHQLSALAQHPDLAAVVDWPPLLELAVELLSPNIYINHSHLEVHPPHPPTGARRWHRDNGLMGRDMRLLWQNQPRLTLKVAIYLTDVLSADDGALEVIPRSHLDTASRIPPRSSPTGYPYSGLPARSPSSTLGFGTVGEKTSAIEPGGPSFLAYSYRWLTSRGVPSENVPEWAGLAPHSPPTSRREDGRPVLLGLR